MQSGFALLAGMILSLAFGNPYEQWTRKWTARLLQISVVGLGAGMNLNNVARAGIDGFVYTVIGISLTLLLGLLLGRAMRTDKETSLLITMGTAICGGSAIAALAPTIRAKNQNISVALATVFFLNALGLLVFPTLGRYLDLNPTQFGLWCALAIHDTSSVVGAAMQHGPRALETATAVKLARALWIVPLVFGIGFVVNRGSKANPKKPWFILGFLLMAAIVTWVPALHGFGKLVSQVSKILLVFTLFLIGSGFSRATLRQVGVRPMIHGVVLWFCVCLGTLGAIYRGWIA